MRVNVDESLCIGSGQCSIFCPEVFELEETAKVKLAEPPERLRSAVWDAFEACPSRAITVTETLEDVAKPELRE